MRLDRPAIAALIPHEGAMCLLDEVLAWDANRITCRAGSHRALGHPMAVDGRLGASAGIEYACQAMAAHGRLAAPAGAAPAAGFLASVRDVSFAVDRLDQLQADLLITAEKLLGEAGRVIYGFSLTCGGAPVMQGRAAVLLHS
jgi:predicted hotdog family 3-hydroxylacyl-ACP dehydratase